MRFITHRTRRKYNGVTVASPSIPRSVSRRSLHPDTGALTMTNKRRREAEERRAKRQRLRHRASSEPLRSDTGSAEKRQALKRLFGRICSVEVENRPPPRDEPEEPELDIGDENEDPLLDSVPVDMDPEQLGFLVCAQETLRFLHGRGIPPHHPMFARLRTRLLQGIGEMAVA